MSAVILTMTGLSVWVFLFLTCNLSAFATPVDSPINDADMDLVKVNIHSKIAEILAEL